MPGIRLSEAELGALDGLPLLARCIYVFGIRPFMDFSNGYVGVQRRISLRSIAEQLYVEPDQGRHRSASGTPTKSAIRNGINALEQGGLVRRKTVGKSLIFYLPKALQDKSARNMSDTSATQKNGTGFSFNGDDLPDMSDTVNQGMSGTHPVSGGGSNKHLCVNQISTTSTQGSGFGLADALQVMVDWGMPKSFAMNKDDRLMIAGWISQGLTREHLVAACERSMLAKKSRNDHKPIGPRYVDKVLNTLGVFSGTDERFAEKNYAADGW